MLVIHVIIFIHTWSSTQRVGLASIATERQTTSQAIFRDREKSLLKHIIVMMFVYVIGWIPLYIGKIIYGIDFTTTFTFRILSVVPIISCLLNIVNILNYHHEFRLYIKQQLQRRIRANAVNIITQAWHVHLFYQSNFIIRWMNLQKLNETSKFLKHLFVVINP